MSLIYVPCTHLFCRYLCTKLTEFLLFSQNIMTFNKCSIDGKAYGDPVDKHGNALDVTEVR
jgi:hypothetical protein